MVEQRFPKQDTESNSQKEKKINFTKIENFCSLGQH